MNTVNNKSFAEDELQEEVLGSSYKPCACSCQAGSTLAKSWIAHTLHTVIHERDLKYILDWTLLLYQKYSSGKMVHAHI